MITNLAIATPIFAEGGLSFLQDSLVKNWFGPALLIILGFFALKAALSRAMGQFATLLAVGVAAALFIYGAPIFFGESGTLTEAAKTEGEKMTKGAFGVGMLDQLQAMWHYSVAKVGSLL